LDTAPIRLGGSSRYSRIDAVADLDRHFVAWSERTDTGQDRLFARGISPLGRLIDAAPVLLLEDVGLPFHLAAGANGAIALTYGGNQFRTITSQYLPILLSDLSAESTPDGVEVSWTVHQDGFQQFDVWRREGETDPLEARVNDGPIHPRLGLMSVLDREVIGRDLGGVRYFIVGLLPSGQEERFGPVLVDPGTESMLQLAVAPNPAASVFTVDFTLPARRATWIELMDSGGRRVLSERLGEDGPGRRILQWPPNEARIESGAYWVRLCWGAESRVVPLRVVR
jgi:hypothetical protein